MLELVGVISGYMPVLHQAVTFSDGTGSFNLLASNTGCTSNLDGALLQPFKDIYLSGFGG